MSRIPSRFFEIATQLQQGKQPERHAVRNILNWFGAERRGEKIVAEIQTALRMAGLKTDPDFTHAGVDEVVRFALLANAAPVSEPQSTAASAQTDMLPKHKKEAAIDVVSTPIAPTADYLEPEVDDEETTQAVEEATVLSQPHDWTISTLEEKFKRGKLNLQPEYQREYVWRLRPELPSRLIESILLEIPIPPLYFGRTLDGDLEVIDGQQRLTTLINFVRNDFSLRKLQRRSDLNGKLFKNLPDRDQTKISDAAIRSVVIDTRNNSDLRYEVFERLNRGSMALNEQELRNCVYHGPFNDLLRKLEEDPWWRKIKGGDNPEPRFIEREMILRFFAFANRLPYYGGNLKRFLNEYMKTYAPRDIDQLQEQSVMFSDAMRNIYAVFGDRSGRLYTISDRANNGVWDTKFSITALDIQASALMRQSHAKVQMNAEQIRELFLFFLLTDADARDAISKQTSGTAATAYRWTKFRSMVQPILDGTTVEPRFFSLEFRRKLFDKSPKCELCGNQIHSFEDSTVDHVHAYSKGGKTVSDNAQLAHRSCNARKNTSLGLGTT